MGSSRMIYSSRLNHYKNSYFLLDSHHQHSPWTDHFPAFLGIHIEEHRSQPAIVRLPYPSRSLIPVMLLATL